MMVLTEEIQKVGDSELSNNENSIKAREELIQISRRIDWRFLLPGPALHDVVFIGPENEELTGALQYFSSFLEMVAPVNLPDFASKKQNRFDLVVINSVDSSAIKLANEILKPGGHLYWEINRKKLNNAYSLKMVQHRNGREMLSKALSLFRYNHVRVYKNYLKSLGFEEVEINWHRPNFQNCKELIPLEAPEALRYVFSRGRSGLAGQIKRLSGKLVYQSELLPYVVPCFSLVARKSMR